MDPLCVYRRSYGQPEDIPQLCLPQRRAEKDPGCRSRGASIAATFRSCLGEEREGREGGLTNTHQYPARHWSPVTVTVTVTKRRTYGNNIQGQGGGLDFSARYKEKERRVKREFLSPKAPRSLLITGVDCAGFLPISRSYTGYSDKHHGASLARMRDFLAQDL